MCVILAKYLPETGWIGVKNRDRGYYPIINIKKSFKNDIERIYIWDENTGYTEGLNEHGVSIISASMATISDEKGQTITHEGTRNNYLSPDGKKIRTALLEHTCQNAIKNLVENELTGHTFVFDQNRCFLLESGYRTGNFIYKIQEISKHNQCVRTNHGILLPWAGYQRLPDDPGHSRKRVSSEVRKIKSEMALLDASTLDECMESILDHSEKNPQLNPCRIDDRKGYMKTTGQIALVPKLKTLYYRPIWSGIKFNYDKLNSDNDSCFFEILSRRSMQNKG
jgi:hypothetical protein